MSPRSIAQRSRERGLDLIALCDHNSAENVLAVRKAAEHVGVEVIGGMEITTKEEVHILALFDRAGDGRLLALQAIVYQSLQGAARWQDVREQVIANEDDEVVGFNRRPLVSATRLSLEQTVETIHHLGGLAIASHIDREGFGILGQLGFIPPGLPLDGVEVSARTRCADAREMFSVPYPFVTASDAHVPDDIGIAYVTLYGMNEFTIEEIGVCLACRDRLRCERVADR